MPRTANLILLLLLVHSPALAQQPPLTREAKTTRLFDFLMKEYGLLLDKTKDRMGRSLVAVCIARIGRDDATDRLLAMLTSEKDPMVRMVAWEGLIARGPTLNQRQHAQLIAATTSMAKADLFRGQLRLPAVKLLSGGPADRPAKDAWLKLFAQTDSTRSGDDQIIDALADTLASWQSTELGEYLIRRAAVPEDCIRADRILRRLGSNAPAVDAANRQAVAALAGAHSKWWWKTRIDWKERKSAIEGAAARIEPHLIPAPQPFADVDPDDKQWRKDLELRAPNLKAFDVGFCVDATGSMGAVLEWLKKDLARMMQGFGAVALEPRIGLTFYRDKGDEFVAVTVPLTHRIPDLLAALDKMRAAGGGDFPEAVLEGLLDCFKQNRWSAAASARKIVILIGDAPPQPASQADCEKLVEAAVAKGFKLYAVKCSGRAPLEFDRLAQAGGGAALELDMTELMNARMRILGIARRLPTTTPTTQPAAPVRPAGHRVLSQVLIDVINPQFHERIDPVVAILWELLDDISRETAQELAGPRR